MPSIPVDLPVKMSSRLTAPMKKKSSENEECLPAQQGMLDNTARFLTVDERREVQLSLINM